MYIPIFRLLQRILDKFQFVLAYNREKILFKKSIGFETKTTTWTCGLVADFFFSISFSREQQ